MATQVTQIVVYEVNVCHSNCEPEKCPREGRDSPPFVYDEWPEAAARMKQFFDSRPRGCEALIMVDVGLMTREEYDSLPED
jgi:hypothetical protein